MREKIGKSGRRRKRRDDGARRKEKNKRESREKEGGGEKMQREGESGHWRRESGEDPVGKGEREVAVMKVGEKMEKNGRRKEEDSGES